MLRLRACVLSRILSIPSTFPISSVHRLISAAAPTISPHPGFAVEDYLVETCGLTRPQALKASTKLSHLKSPANPDAVLAFLASLGLPSADVAAVVARDPQLLCAGVGRTLAPVFVGLTDLGLSRPEVARLVSLAPHRFRLASIVPKLQYYLPLFGSVANLFSALKDATCLLSTDLENVVKPNVIFLRECRLSDRDIAKLAIRIGRMLSTKPECVPAMAACAEGIGVPRGSGMFRHALKAVAFLSKEKITAKVDFLKKTFRWSDAEVSIVVTKAPMLLRWSEDMLRRKCEFLISEVGLEPVYIVHRPALLTYSMEGRLRPRYYVLKFLQANGFLDQNRDYYYIVKVREEVFVKKFIRLYKETAPHLTEDYEAACREEMPTRFRFT